MTVGTGKYTYKVIQGWGQLPKGWEFGWIPAVAVDSQDRVYVFSRSDHPLVVFDCKGNFLTSWGEGILKDAHGIFIDSNDHVYCVDRNTHVVRKFTTGGQLLMTLGTEGRPGKDDEPFNRPTGVAVSPSSEIYVSDGYSNARVHKFSPTGKPLLSWGSPGDGPGQFNLPHSVWVDRRGRVLVADRENNRIQIFSSDGEFLDQWVGFLRPDALFIDADDTVYVAELDQRVSILTLKGELLARWGGEKSSAPGQFLACPHGIWVDSRGDLYVSEVQTNDRIQKFVRRSS